jgi:hypothetical protein
MPFCEKTLRAARKINVRALPVGKIYQHENPRFVTTRN